MPVLPRDVVLLPVSENQINASLQRALRGDFVDNLRHRSSAVQLDCKIRGYLGEIALRDWFSQYDVFFQKANIFDDSIGIDIDFQYKTYNLEVKTSLIADAWGNLRTCLKKGDIKLIRRKPLIEELSGDVHLQIYYGFRRKERDEWLSSLPIYAQETQADIYELLRLAEYQRRIAFVGWIDKNTLIQQILEKKTPTWAYGQREFWRCNLTHDAKPPMQIIDYLHGL